MMKKLLPLLLAVMLLAVALPALAEGEWDMKPGLGLIAGYSGEGGNVAIPAQIDGRPVNALSNNVLNTVPGITGLAIPGSVKLLCNGACCYLNDLTVLELEEGLQVLGPNVFSSLPKLEKLTIPSTVRYIGQNALNYLEGLKELTFLGECPVIESTLSWLPDDCAIYVPDDQVEAYRSALKAAGVWSSMLDQVKPSGKNAVPRVPCFDASEFTFDAATGTLSAYTGNSVVVDIPAEIGGTPVLHLGEGTFYMHPLVSVVTLPEGLVSVEKVALRSNNQLMHVQLPESLEIIGESAFETYQGTLVFGPNVKSIGDKAFRYSKLSGALTLPEGLTTIGANAFSHCNRITEVEFPASIEYIGEEAFKNCYFDYILFNGYTVPQVGEEAFGGYLHDKLLDVDTPWDGTRAMHEAYKALFDPADYPNLTVWRNNPSAAGVCVNVSASAGAVYENGLLTIYNGPVTNASVYTSIDDMDIVGLGEGVFKGNKNINSFYPHHCGWFTTIGKEAFADSSVTYVELFDSITTIGEGAFRNCAGLTELVIPDSVTEIGEGAFEGCTGLQSVLVLCDASIIPEGSFASCADVRMGADASDEQLAILSARTQRPWHSGVLRVGESSKLAAMPDTPTDETLFEFDAASGMILRYWGKEVDVVIPREIGGVTVRAIRANAFDQCADYTGTSIESNVTDWVRLNSVVLPETIEVIEDGAFSYCQQLRSVVCYAPLDNSGKNTFAYCRSLQTVSFINGIRRLDTMAFYGCDSLENLYYGDKLQAIGMDVFSDSKIRSVYLNAEVLEACAIRNCPELTEIHLGPNVQKAEFLAISDCPKLEKVWYEGVVFNAGDGLTVGTAAAVTAYVRPGATEDEKNLALKRTCAWNDPMPVVTVVEQACDANHADTYVDADGKPAVTAVIESVTVEPESAPVAAEPAPVPAEPVSAASAAAGDFREVKYVVTTAETSGVTLDASMLGAEYSVVFHSDASAEMILAGIEMPGLTWTEEGDTVTVDYYGTLFVFVPCESGFQMNYFDTMLLTYVPQ